MHKICQNVGKSFSPSTCQLPGRWEALRLGRITSRYFSASANLDVSAWSADGTGALERCGHCDNCLRDSTSYKREDKTLEAWQILKVAEEVYRLKGNVTIAGLAALAGGSRQSKIRVKQRRGAPTEIQIDVNEIAGGKVNMTISVSCPSVSLRPFY